MIFRFQWGTTEGRKHVSVKFPETPKAEWNKFNDDGDDDDDAITKSIFVVVHVSIYHLTWQRN
jgi:hypothetical protein